jgi:hypothetical protein
MQSYDEIEQEVRKLAHSMPPSDFGSTRAIHAVAQFVMSKLEGARKDEREECAKLIEEVQEGQRNTPDDTTYYVSPRSEGNLAGLAYAAAIRERTNS